jgi:hypothetical protein
VFHRLLGSIFGCFFLFMFTPILDSRTAFLRVRYSLGLMGALAVVCFGLSACEYEWKDEPARVQSVSSGGENSEEVVVKEEVKPPPPADVRPLLQPGKAASGRAELPPKAKKIDLTQLAEAGGLSVSSNVPGTDLAPAYDEAENSLAKSEGTNPFKLTFQFANPVAIKAIRVLSTYSDYGWAVQLESGERLVVDSIIDGEWSTIAWPAGVKTGKVTVEVLRLLRDNYVHLNEVEIYE